MRAKFKLVFGVTMTVALGFGFLHAVYPEALVSFKRLHIFLFNLCAGGALILYHTERSGKVSLKVIAYFAVALAYALSAALWYYPATLALSIPLFYLVESTRIQHFSFFPFDFFKRSQPVYKKFNHASLLCLSLGIVIASFVILNNEYLHLIENDKLTLDVFFLGYSFPISLITMSVMFSFIKDPGTRLFALFQEFSFWTVNLGVIVFFAFILTKIAVAEIAAAITLFLSVSWIFAMFIKHARPVQQKVFLISGMLFLLSTALTGIFYILAYFAPVLEQFHAFLLTLHAMVSLYGWNLSGLFIIIRWEDFPIQLNSMIPIGLHWLIVLVLAPFAMYIFPVSALALPAYMLLLAIVFTSKAKEPLEQ